MRFMNTITALLLLSSAAFGQAPATWTPLTGTPTTLVPAPAFSAVQVNSSVFKLKGSSTGLTSLATANASATNYTATLQAADGTIAYTADITKTAVGLANVTNDVQTKASIVPNTAPAAGQILAGNAGGTAYAPVTLSGSGATASLSSAGVLTLSAIANASLANSTITIAGTSVALGGSTSSLPSPGAIGGTTPAAITGTTIKSILAATQDAVTISGRAGGTGSFVATITPTTLAASRTITIPDASGTIALTSDLGTVTVADEAADTTCFPLFATSATGSLLPVKSNAGLTCNAATATLGATKFRRSGDVSSSAWTTAGLLWSEADATITDTTSSGTVAAAYSSKFGNHLVAASSPVTFTEYTGAWFKDPTAGANVTFVRVWALGADSAYVTGDAKVGTNLAVIGTSQLQGTIELGHATDTTIARVSAGVVSIEGSNILTAATGQPLDATLTAFAGLTIAANSLTIGTAADTFSQTTFAANTFPARASTGNLVAKTITDFGLSLIDDADASAARTTIGLGTIATQAASSVAITGGTLSGLTGLAIRDTSAAFDVTLAATSSTALTAGRTLTIDMANAERTLKLTGNVTGNQDVSTLGTPQFAGLGVGVAYSSTKFVNLAQNYTDPSGTSDVISMDSTANTLTANNANTIRGIGSSVRINQGGFNATASLGAVRAFSYTAFASGSSGTVTAVIGNFGRVGNATAGGTATNAYANYVQNALATGTVTNNFAYYTENQTAGTNNYGYYSLVNTGGWQFYGAGTGESYLGGTLQIGHTGTALGKLESRATSGAQIVASNTAAEYLGITVNNTGAATYAITSAGTKLHSFSDPVTVTGLLTASTHGATGAIAFKPNSLANGQAINFDSVTELTTIAAAATTDTTITIPANAVVYAVTTRVTTVIPTATAFDVGIAGATTRYATGVSAAANTTNTGTADATRYYSAATAIRITPNMTPANNSGRVRVTIFHYTVTPATSAIDKATKPVWAQSKLLAA